MVHFFRASLNLTLTDLFLLERSVFKYRNYAGDVIFETMGCFNQKFMSMLYSTIFTVQQSGAILEKNCAFFS